MDLSIAEISAMLGAYILPLFRIGSMVMVAPIFSSNFINVRTRLIIALAITLVVVPTINTPIAPFTPLSAEGILLISQEIMIGICMGFMLQLLINAFIIAGQIMRCRWVLVLPQWLIRKMAPRFPLSASFI